nr:hypothetical protein [Actinomycetota bacterium]
TCEALSAAFPDLELVTVPSFIVSDGPRETVTDPDRIVVGTTSPEAAQTVTAIMSKVAPGALLLVLPPLEAELVKLCSNVMLAAKVAVANELAGVCAAFDSSWERIQAAVGLDRRIGRDHLGVTEEKGFEGALARDLDGLVAAAASAGYAPAILQEMARFNRRVRSEARARRSTDPVRTV